PSVTGGTSFAGPPIPHTAPVTLSNFTNGGPLTNPAGLTLTWAGGSNAASGQVTVAGTLNTSYWSSLGRTQVNPSGTLANTQSSPMVFGGGSTTYVGIYNPSNGQVTPGGTINIGNGAMPLQGGSVRTHGTIT